MTTRKFENDFSSGGQPPENLYHVRRLCLCPTISVHLSVSPWDSVMKVEHAPSTAAVSTSAGNFENMQLTVGMFS
jgi:hypothetical protein